MVRTVVVCRVMRIIKPYDSRPLERCICSVPGQHIRLVNNELSIEPPPEHTVWRTYIAVAVFKLKQVPYTRAYIILVVLPPEIAIVNIRRLIIPHNLVHPRVSSDNRAPI